MKPPLTNPPPSLERGADYDTPQTYARIGRALMLFLFTASADKKNKKHMEWICAGVAHVNGAPLIERNGMTLEPSAHPSHWMNPRGSWGGYPDEDDFDTPEEYDAAKAVEWRCGWCGATENTAKAKAPCGDGESSP